METIYYIGYTTNEDDRWKASSGGLGTAITRYLLSQPEYGTSVTFRFNREKCMYEPLLIHNADDINVCGSIYQDIDIPRFLQEHIEHIKGGIIVSCTPCQVTSVRQILTKNRIPHFIISFCCSGQTTIEGTWKYYELLGIHKKDVTNMQYRGNGWPSGIQIWLKDGTVIRKDNYTEPWVTMHRSHLFRPKRCFYCKLDTGRNADIALADPWLDKFRKNDRIGNSILVVNTETGKRVIEAMIIKSDIELYPMTFDEYALAQQNNLKKAEYARTQKAYIRKVLKLQSLYSYWNWASLNGKNMRRHMSILRQLHRISSFANFATFIMNIPVKTASFLRKSK